MFGIGVLPPLILNFAKIRRLAFRLKLLSFYLYKSFPLLVKQGAGRVFRPSLDPFGPEKNLPFPQFERQIIQPVTKSRYRLSSRSCFY